MISAPIKNKKKAMQTGTAMLAVSILGLAAPMAYASTARAVTSSSHYYVCFFWGQKAQPAHRVFRCSQGK